MALTYLTAAQANAACEAMFPAATIAHTASATNGTTTLTFTASEAASITPGMTVTGAGITSGGLVTASNLTTGVVTISGTITTLTATNYVFTQAQWGSLHTTTPGTTGAAEVSGGSYTRQSVTFGVSVSGVKTSTNAQSWTGMPSATVGYFGFFTVSGTSGGTWEGGGILGSSLTVPSGATVYAAIGAITATVAG
jgi:hypothetical protein